MKTDLVVAGYIFDDRFDNERLLLIHHKKLNLWLPVGGHIEKDETPDTAMLREAREEVGLKVKILSENPIPLSGNIKKNLANPFYVNVHSVWDHDHCCFFYGCIALNPEEMSIKKSEIKSFKWFFKKELSEDYLSTDVRDIGLLAFNLFYHDSK